MFFRGKAIGLAALLAMLAMLALTGVRAQPVAEVSAPASTDDVHTPISTLASSSSTMRRDQKVIVYRHSVDVYLSNVKLHHPELLLAFTEYFTAPLPDHGGDPAGLIVWQSIIDRLVARGENMLKDGTELNSLNLVAIAGQAHFNNTNQSASPSKP